MATYLKAYQDYLTDTLQKGGASEDVASCVDEFNAVGVPDAEPTDGFYTWMKYVKHTCSTCGTPYACDSPREMTDEQTCWACRETKP